MTPPAEGAASEVVRAHGVSKVFATPARRGRGAGPPTVHALDDVSFVLAEQEFLSIVGPSGCGKSTLLSIIAGFDQPSSGAMLVHGAPVAGPSRERGVIFQADALFHWMTVAENVGYGLRMQHRPKAEIAAIVERNLGLVGLSRFRDAFPAQLSGGMRQRVAIARALATDPEILLMDEPFGALDVLTRKKMQGELARLWLETRKTVLLVTHSIEEAILLSDRILVMSRLPGRIRETVAVPFARPRSPRDPAFRELELRITELIMSDLEDAEPL